MFLRILLLLVIVGCQSHDESYIYSSLPEPVADYRCTPSREYITLVNFFRDNSELKLPEPEARKLAMELTAGCRGSAWRFIQVFKLLLAAKLDTARAITTAKGVAVKDDADAVAFINVFKFSYFQEYLDLPLSASLDLAQRLSVDFKGNTRQVADDFTDLVEFCLGRSGLGMPRTQCAQLVVDIVKSGEPFKEGVGGPFISAVEFLRQGEDDGGPNLTTHDAIQMSRELVAISPAAPANFIKMYEFATAKSGLDLDRTEGLKLAQSVARQTRIELEISGAGSVSKAN